MRAQPYSNRSQRLFEKAEAHPLQAAGLIPWLAGFLALAAYFATLAPAVFTLDSPELTAAAHTLGIVHSPGYPVYLLLGHPFLKAPLSDAVWQMNLLSALAAAATAALVANGYWVA